MLNYVSGNDCFCHLKYSTSGNGTMGKDLLKLYKQYLNKALSTEAYVPMSASDFNKGLDHILDFLDVAVKLFCEKNYNIPVFLAITAMEEKVKLEIHIYCSHPPKADGVLNKTGGKKRGALYDHKTKHALAPSPVISIGDRLKKAIGDARQKELLEQSLKYGFTKEREGALYIEFKEDGKIVFPKEAITRKTARDFILFAIEVIDDGLVGYTEYSLNEISSRLDYLWNMVCEEKE